MLERTPAPPVIPTTPVRPVVRREQDRREEREQRDEGARRFPIPPERPDDGLPHIDEYAGPLN